MTRKHFALLAVRFYQNRPCPDSVSFNVWAAMVRATADVCASVNPNFNGEKFFEACGGVLPLPLPAAGRPWSE